MATMLAALSESIVLTESIDLSVSDLLEVLYVFKQLFGLFQPEYGKNIFILTYHQPQRFGYDPGLLVQ